MRRPSFASFPRVRMNRRRPPCKPRPEPNSSGSGGLSRGRRAAMADRGQETLWVLRAQVGARDALDALFRAVQAPLYRYALGLVGDAALAEDVLQEVFLRVYRKLPYLREPEL